VNVLFIMIRIMIFMIFMMMMIILFIIIIIIIVITIIIIWKSYGNNRDCDVTYYSVLIVPPAQINTESVPSQEEVQYLCRHYSLRSEQRSVSPLGGSEALGT